MNAPTCPPGIGNAALESAFGSYTALLSATTAFWTGALARQASPADLAMDFLDWSATVSRRDRPQWATEHQIVANWPIARLRDFSVGDTPNQIPTLLLPPQAGHDSCIVDFASGQSQVGTAKEVGLTRVFSLDWIGATPETKDASIEDYVAVIHDTVEQLGGRVNLVGDCQGGWLATIYAALYPESMHTLTVAGAPIDFHAGNPLIFDWMKVLSPAHDLAFYRQLVARNDGALPGEYLLGGFIAMQPDVELSRQLQLLAHINEPEHVARYRQFETWFKHTQPIPGTFYLWIVEHLFQNNELISGELVVGDRTVKLSDISCPLYLVAGITDHITPPQQVFALADHASTDASQVDKRLVESGHLGLFMGHESLRNHWAPIFTELAKLSVELESVPKS